MRRLGDSLSTAAEDFCAGRPIEWVRLQEEADPTRRQWLRNLETLSEIRSAYALIQAAQPELQIRERIGRGAFSAVYRAYDPDLQREVALKVFDVEKLSSASEQRILREGRMMARVSHPNVAQIFGVRRAGGQIQLLMELVNGSRLDEAVRKGVLMNEREASLVGLDLCRALAAVHRAGVVHGDVKAENVIRDEKGRIKLTDFGSGLDRRANKETFPVSGTPLYCSPEVLRTGQTCVRSDIYSLGVLLFFLVSGQHPVAAETLDELIKSHADGNRRNLRDLQPELSDRFVRVIEKATDPAVENRYVTAGEMEKALSDSLLAQEELGSARRRPVKVFVLMALIALAATILVVLLTSSQALSVRADLYRLDNVGDGPEILANDSQISLGDRLFVKLTSNRDVYFYLLNQDAANRSYLLFAVEGPAPLPGGQEHTLPAKGEFWVVDTAGEAETFFLVASTGPVVSIEEKLHLLERPREVPPNWQPQNPSLRGVGAIVREPGRLPLPLPTLVDQIREELSSASGEVSKSGYWMREISVRNPDGR